MLTKPGWAASLERWTAFWEGDLVDRPPWIAHISATQELEVGSHTLQSEIDVFDAARNEALLTRIEEAVLAHADLGDDTPPALVAGGGVYFSGAVFGAPVRATADMVACEPILGDGDDPDRVGYDPDSIWVQRALGLARQLVQRGADHGGTDRAGTDRRYTVIPGLLEGPGDIAANLRGPTRLAADLYERPAWVRRLTDIGAAGWEAHARALFDIVPLVDGGSATQWSLWTPGRGAALQEDFCTLISPRQYREFFLPLDRQLARVADITWMHIHAGALHLVDEVLAADEIRGIQIVYDGVVSPSLADTIPVLQRVQARGRCLILRKYSPADLRHILPHLSPRRLALDIYHPSLAEAHAWPARLASWAFDKQGA